ncbi:unnamed protein product [Spodoptera littoralis]|uniref:Fanconi anemia group D2 protein n=1 Tax=Spodoptera littoralis TaxID=7109 RepID=A0A9P0I841_SPOLI|nr:unnamed protein product [Spodoptera littoralis]CAH1643222.1 unnamed protein product [Spodoptera littoralis]
MSKRASSELNNTSQSKKSKDVSSTYFHVSLRESGLILKHPPEKCTTSFETIQIIRNLKKNLEKHFDYPRNLIDLFMNLEDECKDLEIFKHYLFPNIMRIGGDSGEEYLVNDSVIKILLSVPVIQNKITEYIFEKAIDLAAESKCGPWIRMILKCFSSLDSIVTTDKISTNLINLLDVASEKMVKLEIITAIPDIIGDQEHDNIATEMSRILSEDRDLIPAILDCLSYLCLSDDQYAKLQTKSLNLLSSLSRCSNFPNYVKFLLMPGRMSDASYLETVQGLRNALGWTISMNHEERTTSQILTATAIRNSMISSKVISNSWLKAISLCKESASYKPIDLIVLFIAYSTTEEKKKQVENLIRKQVKLNILKIELLDKVFIHFQPILREYLKHVIDLSNSLLKTNTDPDSSLDIFTGRIYTHLLKYLDDCRDITIAGLLQLGLDSKHCVMKIIVILNDTFDHEFALLKSQSVQMLTLLDRLDTMSLDEVRGVMNVLCALAYSFRESVIRDDLHMIIRKELGSSNPRVKVQGILAGVYAVRYLLYEDTSTVIGYDRQGNQVTHTADLESNARDTAQIIELLSQSTRQFPDMTAFFYDELSKVVLRASLSNKQALLWLTDAVTNDLQQNFIVDSIEVDRINDLKLTMQYCLNAEGEIDEVIAINIAGLTLDSKAEVYIGILSPLFQLVQTLHYRQYDGNLSSIDALLGCPVIMPKFDINLIEDMDSVAITNILDCLVHCINWFIELINAFATQNDKELNGKILKRIYQIEELETTVKEILIRSKITYKPPICSFNVNKYTGEQLEVKPIKAQTGKQKGSTKKPGQDDSVLPQTARSQATQNNASVKNSLELSHNIPVRQLNLNIIHLIKTEMTEEKASTTELTVKTLTFLLKSLNSNIEKVLLSKIKRKTFLSNQNSVAYNAEEAEKCAKTVKDVLPQMVEHLKFVTLSMDKCMGTQDENEVAYTLDLLNLITCLESIFNFCTIFFKWVGFKQIVHSPLLKSSLNVIANTTDDAATIGDLLITVAQNLLKYEKYCLQISTAISLIEFLKSIQIHSDSRVILNISKILAQNFLSRQWKTPEGILEKGLLYNQSIDILASIYFINKEVLALKNLSLQLTEDIKLLKSNKNTLSTFKCINKSNFPIFYRNLGSALHDATKACLEKGMTNSEHLHLWKEVATIMKHMSDIAKTLENRNNLTAFFKKSLPVLKLFISQGIPILEIQFKSENQEVLEILKILQQSTRFLQTLCCHSRLKKDTVLMSKVPHMRQLLETLIYKVKAVLAANNCTEAFWMGNLKNKDIHGEVIASQQSVESEDSVEDCDEQLPEDEDSDDTDDDMLNPDSRSVSDIV